MSITQTYYLAHSARGKLSHEAARADHDLRLLVGHANLLDSLMIELAEAEQEQESWFNQSVNGATKDEPQRHIQWADAIIEEPEDDWEAEDADSDSDDSEDDEDEYMEDRSEIIEAHGFAPLTRVTSHTTVLEVEADDDDEGLDGAEDYLPLTLTRSSTQPPELVSHDSEDESSDDESMPPTPPAKVMPTFSEKQRQQIATTSYYDSSRSQSKQACFFKDVCYLSRRKTTDLVSAISVY